MIIFGMPLALVVSQLLLGMINGAFYATLSLGLAVIFGMLNVVNFVHGALYMLGALVAWLLFFVLVLSMELMVVFVKLVFGETVDDRLERIREQLSRHKAESYLEAMTSPLAGARGLLESSGSTNAAALLADTATLLPALEFQMHHLDQPEIFDSNQSSCTSETSESDLLAVPHPNAYLSANEPGALQIPLVSSAFWRWIGQARPYSGSGAVSTWGEHSYKVRYLASWG